MTDPQPQLPPTSAANTSSVAKLILAAIATWAATQGADFLIAHEIINSQQGAQFISEASAAIIAGGTLAWAWWQNRQKAQKLVAAAATGDPQPDMKSHETQEAIATAIADPNSAILAKP